MTDDARRPYEPPEIQSERAFTVLAAGCGLNDPMQMVECDPYFGASSRDEP